MFSLTHTSHYGPNLFDRAIDQKGKPTPIGSMMLASYLKLWNFPVSLRRLDGAVNDTVPSSAPPPQSPTTMCHDRDHDRTKKQKLSTDDHVSAGSVAKGEKAY
ncbi:hypothetical protein AAVH_20113 [Aphelenchoides avenae]|nr:hypothetical protein AAVH_25149 [Aphelenchus avenae]KAH7712570.1 hypothetical protein AAVH_20113 [Aphelenchus avenae]